MTTTQQALEALKKITKMPPFDSGDAIRMQDVAIKAIAAIGAGAPSAAEPVGYFAYDPENGVEFFKTESEAIAYANESLKLYREAAQFDGEWPDDVEAVRVGIVTQRAKVTEYDDGSDYTLAAPPAPQSTSSEPVDAFPALHALTEAIMTRAAPDFLRRRLDEAVQVMATRGWSPPIPWPPEAETSAEKAKPDGSYFPSALDEIRHLVCDITEEVMKDGCRFFQIIPGKELLFSNMVGVCVTLLEKGAAQADAPVAEPVALTDEQWLDLAARHSYRDWGEEYVAAIKAVCMDYAAIAARRLATEAALAAAARDVLAERKRQLDVEGWSPEHDDVHYNGEMARAAASYALSASAGETCIQVIAAYLREKAAGVFPWDPCWWKPAGPRRDLVKAGALVLAEIERLDRAAMAQGERG